MEIAIFLGFLIILRLLVKNIRTYKIILGFILMLVSIPAGIFLEFGLDRTPYQGAGFLLVAVLFIGGLILTIRSIGSSKI
jgi:FtsH-binding integral membrane protein